jgi:hypothetical protein
MLTNLGLSSASASEIFRDGLSGVREEPVKGDAAAAAGSPVDPFLTQLGRPDLWVSFPIYTAWKVRRPSSRFQRRIM